MRWLGLLTLLFAGAVGLLLAADEKKPNDAVKGFAVHEWGVFRVHDDAPFANATMRAEWDGLPKFVYGQTTSRDIPRHWEDVPLEVLKPVLFFHAPATMPVEVRVEFPGGVPAVWWPATHNPAIQGQQYDFGEIRPVEQQVRSTARTLEWKLHVKQPLPGAPPAFKPLDKQHWMNALRDVKCDDVYAPVGQRNGGLNGMEREKFVYYDGLLPRIEALAITIEKDQVKLKNKAKYAVFDVWVIDNRAAPPRVGRLPRLDADAARDVALVAPTGKQWDEDTGKALTAQLKDAGLNEDEAASLTTIWAADFFHSAGVTLFYRLPQEEYDRMLPLTVKPRPEKVVRVGLVQQIPNDPELAERIAKLVKQLDDDRYEKREAAQQELAKLGPVAVGYLQRLKPTITAPEPKRRVDELLEKYEAQRTLKN